MKEAMTVDRHLLMIAFMARMVDTLTAVELTRQRRWNLSGKGQSEFIVTRLP